MNNKNNKEKTNNEIIKIINICNSQKFISVKLPELTDGFLVAIVEDGQGISIAYKGEVKVVKFIKMPA